MVGYVWEYLDCTFPKIIQISKNTWALNYVPSYMLDTIKSKFKR